MNELEHERTAVAVGCYLVRTKSNIVGMGGTTAVADNGVHVECGSV